LVVGRQIRCPRHHACFDLRSGEAIAAPALSPIPCYRVERRDQVVAVVGRAVLPAKAPMAGRAPSSIVIVCADAAGHATAAMLLREGYRGRVLLFGAEPTVPVDRPNLSKDYLAGTAPDEWIPLRPREFFAEQEIELHTGARV